jgi:hypothetical protein
MFNGPCNIDSNATFCFSLHLKVYLSSKNGNNDDGNGPEIPEIKKNFDRKFKYRK